MIAGADVADGASAGEWPLGGGVARWPRDAAARGVHTEALRLVDELTTPPTSALQFEGDWESGV